MSTSENASVSGENEDAAPTSWDALEAAATVADDERRRQALNAHEVQETNTISILEGAGESAGVKVYLVGTAHFSLESQSEVVELIRKVRPTRVVLELCASRVSMLTLDEQTVLQQAKEMDMNKIVQLIKQTSVVHGILQSLLIRLYAKVTEELGMAPGGEFRVAYREAKRIGGCDVILGDMPVNVTLKRGFASLPWYRKLKLGFMLLTTNSKLTKEDIEEMKKTDMLDSLLKEFGSSFPEFKRVLIDERDIYLTHSLQAAARSAASDDDSRRANGRQRQIGATTTPPPCVVGVVGLGHANGIRNNWSKKLNIDEFAIKPAVKKAAGFKYGTLLKTSVLIGAFVFVGLQLAKKPRPL